MENTLSYYFTIYGEVYTGEEISEPSFPDHVILIQRNKLSEYLVLQLQEKTLPNIKKYGWALPRCIISDHLQIDRSEYLVNRGDKESKLWDIQYDRSIMFIIGAGASANCATGTIKSKFDNDGFRPPCGMELFEKRFEKLYQRYPGVIQSLHSLQGEHSVDVEELFEDEWEEISQYGNEQVIARHINIQYYLQELLQSVSMTTLYGYGTENLFAKLADRLQKLYCRNRKQKFAFVSFNQDTILEYFIGRYFNMEYKSLDDYVKINEGPVSVFKPHGSWNWGWKFPDQEARSITIAQWLFQERINLHKIYYELLGNYKV